MLAARHESGGDGGGRARSPSNASEGSESELRGFGELAAGDEAVSLTSRRGPLSITPLPRLTVARRRPHAASIDESHGALSASMSLTDDGDGDGAESSDVGGALDDDEQSNSSLALNHVTQRRTGALSCRRAPPLRS